MRYGLQQRLLAVAVCLLTAALSGCHHAKRASAPVYPAPAAESPAAETPKKRSPEIVRKPPPPATPDADALGKPVLTEVGLASWYGPPYHNHQAADGSIFDQNALTAAHRELPMGTLVRVTNLATEESIIVRITDRGPFVQGRTLDLSLAAAKAIGVYRAGVARVRIEAFAKPDADPAGRWCVQIGAFMTADDAIQLKNDLLRRYASAKVIEFQGPTGFWVRINSVAADKATATRIADSIHIPDADPYLVRLN
jgi:rare lipoprotein A